MKQKIYSPFTGIASALDDSIGNITRLLDARGMLNNTVIAFTTDNGGPANGFDMNAASNTPLRFVMFVTNKNAFQ